MQMRVAKHGQVMDGDDARFGESGEEIIRSVHHARAKRALGGPQTIRPHETSAWSPHPFVREQYCRVFDQLIAREEERPDIVPPRQSLAQFPCVAANAAEARFERINTQRHPHDIMLRASSEAFLQAEYAQRVRPTDRAAKSPPKAFALHFHGPMPGRPQRGGCAR